MRVLIVTHFFSENQIGGTETLTLSLAQSLQAKGHTVQVICAEDWDNAGSHKISTSEDVFQDIPIKRLHFEWRRAPDVFGYLYNNPEVETYFSAYLDEFQPDVVHITSCYSLSASVIQAAHKKQIPIVLTATDFWFICARNTLLQSDGTLCTGPESAWKCAQCMLSDAKVYRLPNQFLPEAIMEATFRAVGQIPMLTRQRGLRGMHGDWDGRFNFLRDALNKVDCIVTASSLVQGMLAQYGAPSERIIFSAYGFDTSWAEDYQDKAPSDRLRLGFIGQIIPMKGVDLLIDAVLSLDERLPVELKIYGNLEKAPEYGQLLLDKAAGDRRIVFAGTFPYDAIGRVLAEMDLLVVPSTWYDFPLVIPSAFATRTPVIATNLAGMNDLVQHEENGLLFERYDVAGLAAQIERLIETPSLRTVLREGIAPVKTADMMTDEYLSIYTTVLEQIA